MAGKQNLHQDYELSTASRVVAGIIGSVLIVAAIGLYLKPPQLEQFPPQCGSGDCIAEVQEQSELLTIALVGIGSLLVLVGINGRVVRGVKFGGAEATLAAEQAKDEAVKAIVAADTDLAKPSDGQDTTPPPGEGDARLLIVAGRDLVRVEPAQVPIRVLTDLAASGVQVTSSADIAWGARELGQEGAPWYVQLRSGRAFRISYAHRGHDQVEVVEMPRSTYEEFNN
jgi:hypothetical protein